MAHTATIREKRTHVRYEVDSGSFAVIQRDPTVLPGLIVDISKGGLAFFYHQDEPWPQNSGERFYLFGEQCNIENVPLITTYDREVTDTRHPAFQVLASQKSKPARIRRRGVKFGLLSREQEEDIELLIDEYYAALR